VKLVFLDIDGVVNPGTLVWDGHQTTEEYRSGTHDYRALADLDETAVKRVNRLCRETGAVVVISSTWRILHRLSDIRGWLLKKGLTVPIIGTTPKTGGPRGRQIQEWLDTTRDMGRDTVESFVILDDDSDMEHLSHRLVQTTFEHGLQDEHVERARVLLETAV
jgi:hypothetical protein